MNQLQVLIQGGVVEGKTNHELAIEMGFSVSTILHKTMRIYQALAASDHREAAKEVLTLSLTQTHPQVALDTLKPSIRTLPLPIP